MSHPLSTVNLRALIAAQQSPTPVRVHIRLIPRVLGDWGPDGVWMDVRGYGLFTADGVRLGVYNHLRALRKVVADNGFKLEEE